VAWFRIKDPGAQAHAAEHAAPAPSMETDNLGRAT